MFTQIHPFTSRDYYSMWVCLAPRRFSQPFGAAPKDRSSQLFCYGSSTDSRCQWTAEVDGCCLIREDTSLVSFKLVLFCHIKKSLQQLVGQPSFRPSKQSPAYTGVVAVGIVVSCFTFMQGWLSVFLFSDSGLTMFPRLRIVSCAAPEAPKVLIWKSQKNSRHV